MTAIDVQDVTKTFRDFWRRPRVQAVRHLSLQIQEGEIFGLLGPNGSGKSTTIKMILGLLNPSSGRITIRGASPHDVRAKQHIGYLPEDSYLYRYLTATETLTFYGNLFDLPTRELNQRIEELLTMAGLTHAAHRPVGQFSKGMMRRLGLAQALINNPDLVILDEPTAGLDPPGCRQVKDLILALARRGTTVLLSSHLLADVEDVCHRIAILFNGRLRATGGVAELLEKKDRVRLTLPALSGAALEEVLATLRRTVGTRPEIDHPSLNLEQFFLEVIADAHDTGETGAGPLTTTPGIADYLLSGTQTLPEARPPTRPDRPQESA